MVSKERKKSGTMGLKGRNPSKTIVDKTRPTGDVKSAKRQSRDLAT